MCVLKDAQAWSECYGHGISLDLFYQLNKIHSSFLKLYLCSFARSLTFFLTDGRELPTLHFHDGGTAGLLQALQRYTYLIRCVSMLQGICLILCVFHSFDSVLSGNLTLHYIDLETFMAGVYVGFLLKRDIFIL